MTPVTCHQIIGIAKLIVHRDECYPACFSEVDEEYVCIVVIHKNQISDRLNGNASLKSYAHDDSSVGSWMMGVQATYIDDSRLCCSSIKQDKVCSLA
ncbi:hypothetical protein POTOM_024258 [Populus tomentosa]|uniref:Hexosyltransferase n=1 Tax=Populus tomentosa TaxID=118781 RepID=A0A8X7ZUZ2_POPTO|nr:hypothetical protein POTOM_024258 [Populus tomentosa]